MALRSDFNYKYSMTKSIFLLLLVSFMTSCVVSNRIVEIDDPYKEIKSIKLAQDYVAHSVEKNGRSFSRDVATTYLMEQIKKDRPILTAKFVITTPISADELDSVLYFSLDGEKISLVSNDYKYKQFDQSSIANVTAPVTKTKNNTDKNLDTVVSVNKSYQVMNRQFIIPENLWVSFENSQEIRCRLYLGKEGIDIKLNQPQKNRLVELIIRAEQIRDEKFPAIPEGQKKW